VLLDQGEVQRLGSKTPSSKVDVRVIAATNRDLHRRSEEGAFRGDLYSRLCVIPMTMPPLRDRLEDVDVIAPRLMRKLAKKYDKRGAEGWLLEADIARLKEVTWPLNVRQLEAALEHALLVKPPKEPLRPGLEKAIAARGLAGHHEPTVTRIDPAAIWGQIKRREGRPENLKSLKRRYGQPVAYASAELAEGELSKKNAAQAFAMSYRAYIGWMYRNRPGKRERRPARAT